MTRLGAVGRLVRTPAAHTARFAVAQDAQRVTWPRYHRNLGNVGRYASTRSIGFAVSRPVLPADDWKRGALCRRPLPFEEPKYPR